MGASEVSIGASPWSSIARASMRVTWDCCTVLGDDVRDVREYRTECCHISTTTSALQDHEREQHRHSRASNLGVVTVDNRNEFVSERLHFRKGSIIGQSLTDGYQCSCSFAISSSRSPSFSTSSSR